MDRNPRTLDQILDVEAADQGCSGGSVLLETYVELEVAGGDPASLYPEWAAHLRSCSGCSADYEGLVEAVRLFGD